MRIATLLLTCLAACGEDPVADTARFERVELTVAERPLPTAVVVRRMRPTSSMEGWAVVSESQRFQKRGEMTELFLRGSKPRSIRVAVDESLESFNRISVKGIFNARLELTLRLFSHAEEPFFQRGVSVNQSSMPQSVEFDLSLTRKTSMDLEALELAVKGGGPMGLLAFDLLDVPIAQMLPLPEDGPQIVPIDNEARRGVGLVSGAPLSGRVAVTDPTEVLSFGLGMPPNVYTSEQKSAEVEVEVGEGESAVRRTFRVPERGAWTRQSISLGGFVGADVPVRFELVGDRGRPVACVLANVELSRPGAPAPSVLVISSDTHRADHLGMALGGVEVETPTLDGLAARGVIYDDAWSSTNVTSPSHVALMTGVHPRDSRIIANTGRLDDAAPTLAEAFADQGWATVGVVSVRHLGPRGIGLGQGFDQMRDPRGEPWDAEEAIDLLLEQVEWSDGRPLFVWLHLFDAHDPYAPPGEFDRRYYPEDKNPYDKSLPDPGWKMGHLPPHMLAVRDPEFPLAQYRGEVSYLDQQLERVIEHPRLRDGWIAFTSDHGEILEVQGSWFNHGELFPATLHVPLILAGPDVPRGVRCAAPVEQAQVGRTLLDLAGFGGVEFPGDNVLAAIDGPGSEARFALSAGGFSAAVTDGRWYLVLNLKKHRGLMPRQRELHEVELYDLSADPNCDQPVTEENREVASGLRARLVEWLEAASPTGFAGHAAVSAEELKALVALGYAGDMPEVGARTWIDVDCSCERCEPWR